MSKLHCLPGKINVYTSHYLCVYEVALQPRSRAGSHATEIILAQTPEEESVDRAITRNEEVVGLAG